MSANGYNTTKAALTVTPYCHRCDTSYRSVRQLQWVSSTISHSVRRFVPESLPAVVFHDQVGASRRSSCGTTWFRDSDPSPNWVLPMFRNIHWANRCQFVQLYRRNDYLQVYRHLPCTHTLLFLMVWPFWWRLTSPLQWRAQSIHRQVPMRIPLIFAPHFVLFFDYLHIPE